MFKFPSKAYPRSSYYVTGNEIIIRIKKARKRWKLVVPKKRVVSYRTNRWFAKPRWVEIELTFTQATRLGLVGPRAPARETTGATTTAVPETVRPLVGRDGDSAADAAADGTDDDNRGEEIVLAFDAEAGDTEAGDVDDGERADSEDESGDLHCNAPAIGDELNGDGVGVDSDDATAIEEAIAFDAAKTDAGTIDAATIDVGGSADRDIVLERWPTDDAMPAAHEAEAALSTSQPGECETEPPLASTAPPRPVHYPMHVVFVMPGFSTVPSVGPPINVMTARSLATARPKRSRAAPMLLSLVVALTGGFAAWLALGDVSATRGNDSFACMAVDARPQCAAPITTGSIDSRAVARVQEPPVVVAEPPPSTAPEAQPPAAEQPEQAASTVSEPPPGATEAAHEPTRQQRPAIESEPLPAATRAADPSDAPECRALRTVAETTSIHFHYASASLEPAALTGLDDVAARLASCAAANLIIEGHTDSDGDADRNHALSVRRAQAVRQHLVSAGTRSAQLSIVGFGHARPAVANETPESKRSNRRVVLVVELPR